MSKIIKVLHIGMSPNYGGIESFTINMHKYIEKDIQFDFINIYDNEKIAFQDEHIRLGSKIFNISSRKKNPIKSYMELKKIIKREKYDFVHFHCMNFCWPEPILVCQNIKGVQSIVHSHLTGFNSNTSKKEKLLDKLGRIRVLHKNYLKLACGVDAGKWLFDKSNFQVINNGIDIEKYKYKSSFRKKIRDDLKLADEDIVIGHIGNFSYQKNYPYLIELFSELKKLNTNYKLLLIGDKNKAGEVIELVEKNKLADQVIFTGIITNANEYYSAMDLFVFPSHYEGFSIAMIEAQASGLKCFCSDTLDKKTDISNNICFLDIKKPAIENAKLINDTYLISYDREKIKISDDFSSQKAAEILSNFYKKNIEKENENV